MAGDTDSALMRALLAELDHRSREASESADGLAAAASDHDRWGLAQEADALRRSARHHQVSALLYASNAEAWRARLGAERRAGP